MRLSSLCLTSLRLALATAVILLFSSAALAQHSSSGGSSAGGSSSSGGGGSHAGSSGGSSSAGSSGGGHSSGGSASSGSSSHGSGSHSSSGSASHASSTHGSSAHGSNAVHPIHPTTPADRTKTEPSQKRGFFSFLRRPIRRPAPTPVSTPEPTKPVADLRRPICFGGVCPVCPAGRARVGGKCSGAVIVNSVHNVCSFGQAWSGGACQWQNRPLDDCAGLRFSLQRQAQRMRAAEGERQNACSTGGSQECSDLTSTTQSEASLYRNLQERYRMCQQRSPSGYSYGGYGHWNDSPNRLLDPFDFELDYR